MFFCFCFCFCFSFLLFLLRINTCACRKWKIYFTFYAFSMPLQQQSCALMHVHAGNGKSTLLSILSVGLYSNKVTKSGSMWIKGSEVNAHIGLWSVVDEFWPPFDKNGTFKVYETIHFLNLHDNLINLSPFSLKSDKIENLTPVRKVNDLLLFWPLSWERNVWILYNWLFCSLRPKEEFDMHYNFIESFWLFH